MRRPRGDERQMGIGEAELASMTEDLRDAHRDTLPELRASLDDWIAGRSGDGSGGAGRGLSRRSFLTGTGLLAAGGLAFAAGGAAASPARPGRAAGAGRLPGARRAARAPLDVEVAALAASLENLAVGTYKAGLSAAKAGKLGSVPKAVATFATTAMVHHGDHAMAWNALVTAGGYKAVTAPNAALAKSVGAAFAKVHDVAGLAELALSLEDAAAATYLEAIGVVTSPRAIETAATIQPVEMQHAAILNFVLGRYPVPFGFSRTTGAATLSDVPALATKA